MTKTVLVAGATGYLGQHIVKRYMELGWHVRALVRNANTAQRKNLIASEVFEGEATKPETLRGVMDGVDLVVSALGITRQRDGLTYRDVDFQANANLLDEALAADAPQFAYIHILNADKMRGVAVVDAKQAFVDRLQAASVASTIICPSGFFSDMADFFQMAKSGRVWLFGEGTLRLNPIDGADLAVAIADAVEQKRKWVDVGGPDILTQYELAELAFDALGNGPKITRLPDVLRRIALRLLPWVTPVRGPAQMFLTAMGMDMVGSPMGTRRLADYFDKLNPLGRGQTDKQVRHIRDERVA
ncbi:MAG: SDR family oxidoreductase [Paracoccaceae bacterium]